MNSSRAIVIERFSLIPILFVAVFLRFWDLARIGLRGDEAVYAGQALILAGNHEMTRFFVLGSRGTSNFLFHQGIQALIYASGGFSDLTTRLLPALFSVLTIVVVFLIGRELFGQRTGLLAAFFLAINGYAVSLGRLALLDSTMTFFFTLSMLCMAKWVKKGEPKWAYFLAASTGMAIMTKVPAALIIPIVLLTMLILGRFRNISHRTLTGSTLIFVASITPAILQFMSSPSLFMDFLFVGTSRVSNVPATYYLDKLLVFAGPFFIVTTLIGIAAALVSRRKGDLLCLTWLVGVAVFFQIYPLKGFNYILPLVPAAAILAGRGFLYLTQFLKPSVFQNSKANLLHQGQTVMAILGIALLMSASYSLGYSSLYNIAYDRPYVGLREAAYWLKDNAPSDAAAMTISHGSAQYVLSLYAKIDSYPFGNFRLHTVLPGGAIISGAPPPEPLIQNGTVTYLVHYVSWRGDDPIHVPVKTPTEEGFINLVLKYQSRLRHVVYYEFTGLDGTEIREPRVWIYEVGKRLPEPQLEVQLEDGLLHLSGSGFLIDSYVSIYYGRTLLGKIPTDRMGSFTGSVGPPERLVHGEQLKVFDERGNRLSTSLETSLTADDQIGGGER